MVDEFAKRGRVLIFGCFVAADFKDAINKSRHVVVVQVLEFLWRQDVGQEAEDALVDVSHFV